MELEVVVNMDEQGGEKLSPTGLALVLSNSSKRIDQVGMPKKYVRQVTGKHNDTDLHLASKTGDLATVQRVLQGIDEQMVCANSTGADAKMAEIRAAVVNELGEMALYIAADRGRLDMVKELLSCSCRESVARKTNVGYIELLVQESVARKTS